MQFTRFCRDFDLVAKYAFSQAPSCTNFLPPGSASDSRTGVRSANINFHQTKSIHHLPNEHTRMDNIHIHMIRALIIKHGLYTRLISSDIFIILLSNLHVHVRVLHWYSIHLSCIQTLLAFVQSVFNIWVSIRCLRIIIFNFDGCGRSVALPKGWVGCVQRYVFC